MYVCFCAKYGEQEKKKKKSSNPVDGYHTHPVISDDVS